MRDTLIEVEGEERGASMYSLDWLEQRVRWHLDATQTTARVMLAETDEPQDAGPGPDTHRVAGHCIVRVEGRGAGQASPGDAGFGLIVTTYVCPPARRSGLAAMFLHEAEQWFVAQGLSHCGTWTSATNTPLIALYQKAGYTQVDSGPNDLTGTAMVKLGKCLAGASDHF
jgi:GNAT superfamily N-acetyltransferase